ncbi:uncharacterized protein TNCV_589921 [Trichonephila clavipes]|nr:uncharacterized protein TNCV_589921 [Trichonephila clavipes]
MARRNHLDDFTRRRMIGKLEEGCTVTSVAAEFGINKSVLSRACKAFQTTRTAVRKVGGGRPRPTTAGNDIYIFLQRVCNQRSLLGGGTFPHVCLLRGAIGPDLIFMDDNSRPLRTLAVVELLESEDITRMD